MAERVPKWLKATLAMFTALSLVQPQFIPGASAAYSFTSHTFTNCGQTGRSGPSQASCRSAYSTTWDETDANFTVVSGIQIWTVPYTGNYRIEAIGAAGSSGNGGTAAGGKGAKIQGDFSLTEGDKIRILVGQMGTNTGSTVSDGASGSGGGGSFVISGTSGTEDSQVLIIAAGGNGSNDPVFQGSAVAGAGGSHTSSGTGNAENNGGSYKGTSTGSSTNGASFANGGQGGTYTRGGSTGFGGFGGGGATDDSPTGGGGWIGGTTANVSAYSKNNGSNQSGTSAFNTSHGQVTITSLGPSITSFVPTTSLSNSTSLTFNLVMSQSVTGIDAGDFAASGTGASTCVVGTVTGSGTSYSIPLTSCSQGTVFLTITANVATNSSSQTGPATNTNSSSVTIDQTAPTISSVSATNGSYAPGSAINLVTSFSESITVTGTPRIPITIGSTTRYANFVSLSDSRTATFRYTVQVDANDIDTDGIAVISPLELNSGSIADLATNSISTLTFTPPVTTSVFVTQKAAAPTINSITPGNTTLSVAFTAGASGGASITNYKYSLNGGSFTSVGGTTSPFTISGLTNGTSYAVRILAVTSAGDGDSSTAVTATPSAVSVGGGSDISRVYGSQSSSSAFTASGGTSPYTFSLSGGATGISIDASTGVVTTSANLAVGTYTPSVVATDSNATPRSGSRAMTITITQATPTISISLPGAATSAAVGATVTITATVSVNGTVNFRLGGATISGCGSVSSSALSATCSWTPVSTGSVVLTAILSPTDSTNYASGNTTNLNISVVNGSTTVSLALAGNVTQVSKGQLIVITASIDQVGRVTFFSDGIRIPNCINLVASGASVNCNWRPAIQKRVNLTARLTPTNSIYNSSTGSLSVWVVRRSGTR